MRSRHPILHCDARAVNFMSRYGRGLICLALTPERVAELGLRMMVPTSPGSMGTAFTVSVEARHGVTTGISAADRAETIRVAADPACGGLLGGPHGEQAPGRQGGDPGVQPMREHV